MRNLKLLIEYDGTGFVGWQSQQNGRSVQDVITAAIAQILRESVDLIGAGRTDAGVHARGQVANFHTRSTMESGRIQRALNAVLPDDVVVLDATDVPEDFHARYSALGRRYRYAISLRPTALGRRYQWYVKHDLNLDAMATVASTMIGEHDFSSFCKANSGVEHHVCTVATSTWECEGSSLVYAVQANRFLHGMVRALVGTMVDVGRGYRTVDDFNHIFAARDRSLCGMAAPAHGLCLEEVIYPGSL